MEIINIGCGVKDEKLNIGDSFIQESVVSIWFFVPEDGFTYLSGRILCVLNKYTKTAERTYNSKTLSKDEVSEEMIEILIKRGRTLK